MVTAIDHEIAKLAERQHGVYSRSQVMELGATPSLVRRRLTSGAWTRAGYDVYAVPGVPESYRRDVMVGCLVVPRAVASHETAACLHGFPFLKPGPVIVTTDRSSTHRTTTAHVFRSAVAIPEDQLDQVDGIPTTSRARTVVDLAGVLHEHRFERLVDDLLGSRAVEIESLRVTFEACARRGRRGIAIMRELLEERGPGDAVTESVLEADVLRLIREAGLPEPVCQHPVPWSDATPGRVDFAYPEQRVIVEADGRRWHARYEDFERDRRRDAEAMRAGWRVLRFTWRQTRDDPGFVTSTLRAVLAG